MDSQTVQPKSNPYDRKVRNTEPEESWRVLVHNDDETPYGYVIYTLNAVFMLSDELAEHVASTAHSSGTAIAAIRPHDEAEMLTSVALGRAKQDGYPLQFTIEHP